MSNAADGCLGDWVSHKSSCRCADCSLERAQELIRALTSERDAARAEIAVLEDRYARMREALAKTEAVLPRFIERNPKWMFDGREQDPMGAHALLPEVRDAYSELTPQRETPRGSQ